MNIVKGIQKAVGVAVVLGMLCGCDGGPAGPRPGETVSTPVDQQKVDLKARLNSIAESGSTGSGLAGLREAIEASGDASLLEDYKKLEAASSPEEAKKIAASMAAKL
jgi:hypothetical protein